MILFRQFRGEAGGAECHKARPAHARHTSAIVQQGTRGQHVVAFAAADLFDRAASPLPVVRYLGASARALREVGTMPEEIDEVRRHLHRAVRRAERRCFWWLLRACWRCV